MNIPKSDALTIIRRATHDVNQAALDPQNFFLMKCSAHLKSLNVAIALTFVPIAQISISKPIP